MKLSRSFYRSRQFRMALFSKPGSDELAEAQRWLPPVAFTLFLRMQPGEQVHSLAVLQKLLAWQATNPDLLAAALLHDIGKIRCPLKPWERAWAVLFNAVLPNRAQRWGHADAVTVGWRRSFVVAEQHAAWGAELVANCGLSPLTVNLIRRHHETLAVSPENILENQLLGMLQFVDNES